MSASPSTASKSERLVTSWFCSAEYRAVQAALPGYASPDRHAVAVAELAELVGLRLNLSLQVLRTIVVGALLHDIGKGEIDHRILSKPGPLDDLEWQRIRRHPIDGERLLIGILTHEVLAVVRSHHERWDGSGYPDALGGNEIPLGARIVAVADAHRAMLEHRPYRTPLTPSEAEHELERSAGTQFDPNCVRAVLDVVTVGCHLQNVAPCQQRGEAW